MPDIMTRAHVLARFGHALSDTTRTALLLALLDGPRYPSQLAELLHTSRSSISTHLGRLQECGLVIATREGRHTRYELHSRLANALSGLLALSALLDPTCTDPGSGDGVEDHDSCPRMTAPAPGQGHTRKVDTPDAQPHARTGP